MPPSDAFARLESALAAAADDLTSDRRRPGDGTVDDLWQSDLTRLTVAAVTHVPGAVYAGLTLRGRDGSPPVHAASHPGIVELDRTAAETGEGPGVEAFASVPPSTVHVGDVARTRDRWPRYATVALGAGVAALLCVPLAPRDTAPGSLTLYATRTGAFDDTARTVAQAFATQAAIVVHGAGQIADLRRAIASRDLIGQAKGILMERFGLDEGRAFDLLVRSSQDTNVKLAEVARWLTGEVARRGRAAPPDVADVGAPASPESAAGG